MKCADNVRIPAQKMEKMAIITRKRKNGEKSYMMRFEPGNGQKTIVKTFQLRRQAEEFEREVKRAKGRDTLEQLTGAGQAVTIAEALQSYREQVLPQLARGGKSKTSLLERIEASFGPKAITLLRAHEIAAWAADLRETLSAQTVHHHLNALSSLIEHARTALRVHVPENPVRLVPRPRLSKARDRRLRGDELQWLMRAAQHYDGPELMCIITLAVETSMRLGELLSMRWELVDLRRQIVHLPDSKNGESRTVALSTSAARALNGLPRRLNGMVLGWVAADSFEKTWSRCKSRAAALYREETIEANRDPNFLKDLRFHDLRHEATSRLFEKGLGIMEVASMTGHKSLQMLKRYTHMDAERLAQKLG